MPVPSIEEVHKRIAQLDALDPNWRQYDSQWLLLDAQMQTISEQAQQIGDQACELDAQRRAEMEAHTSQFTDLRPTPARLAVNSFRQLGVPLVLAILAGAFVTLALIASGN